MDVFLGCVSGYTLGESRSKVGYEHDKVGYATLIPDIQTSRPIHKLLLYPTLIITYLAATHIF